MQLVKLILGLLSFFITAEAFVPWFPAYLCLKEGTCQPEKRAVDGGLSTTDVEDSEEAFKLKLIRRTSKPSIPNASRIARNAQLGTRVGPFDIPLPHGKINARATVTAQTPTQTNSAGIDQDGGDNSYFAEVLLGSGSTPFLMLLDSGASDTWVKSTSCTSAACVNHKTFGPANSTTITTGSDGFAITYGSGAVNGTRITDSLSFAGLSFRMEFGLADFVSDSLLNYNFDGILGLAQGAPSFLDSLVSSKQLKSNIFGVSFSSVDDGPNTSEISFGAPDVDKFTGSLTYSAKNATKPDYWTIPLMNVGYGSSQMGTLLSTPLAYIDTGTTYLFAPKPDIKSFYSLVPGAQAVDSTSWSVPCDTTTPLTLTFAGVTYSIPAKDWVGPMAKGVCLSNLYAIDLDGWLLGDMYLKQVYTVFDVDQERIGFASAKISSAVSSTTGGTSTATASNTTPTRTSSPSATTSSQHASSSGTAAAETFSTGAVPTATQHAAAPTTKHSLTAVIATFLVTILL